MSKTCKIEGCCKPSHARGLCSMHSSRLKRNGTLEAIFRDKSGIAQNNPKEYRAFLHLKERCLNRNTKKL